jgi:hypothetical protein
MSVKAIDIFAELDRLKIKWTSIGEDEIRICCPAHEDSTPSAALNVKEHVWKCFVPTCGASGDFVSLIAYSLKTERRTVLADLQRRYPSIGSVAEIPSQTVEKFHRALSEAGPLLNELRKRGVTDEMMRAARIGFYDGRITIPVYDANGRCINVRRYLPGAPGPQKMRNTTGFGRPALYRVNTIREGDAVLICGGEMKALVAGTLLAEHSIAAVSSTGGEGHWEDSWSELLVGRDVYVCLDVDAAGASGARAKAMAVFSKAKSVKILTLPLDRNKYPKGDINDWVGAEGAAAQDFLQLIAQSPVWVPPTRVPEATGQIRELSLDQAISNTNVAERVRVKAVVVASDTTPFLVPNEIDVECTRDQPNCHMCTVRLEQPDISGWTRMKVQPGSPAILGMLGALAKEQKQRISEAVGIPPCKTVKFHPRSHLTAHDVRLAPPMDLSGERVGDKWFPAVLVTPYVPELNTTCAMTGAVYPHPRTQQAVALVTELEELEDTLSSFKCTKSELDELNAFRADNAEQLSKRVASIVSDLEANVTWILQRKAMHIAVDLAFHSVLMFNYDGRTVNGWMNLLVIGDSAQGKSECALRLMKHYGVGDKVDCKNATVAGLLGGLEQMGNRWFIKWGAIPARDRTLVVLEELKGASTEVLSKLTEMRSSGVAEIPKIERRKALARTRLIMNSNPRSPRSLGSFHFGIEAIPELIGSLEDVRRFDLAIAVSRDEVGEDVINAPRPKVEQVFTSDLCRRLVLWSWTRKPEHVVISPQAQDACLRVSKALTSKFSESVPLIDKGTTKMKVMRMAVALAARTYSSPDGVHLHVGAHHVEYIGRFVDHVYSTKAMGYADFSEAQSLMTSMTEPDVVSKAIRATRHPVDLASTLLRRDSVSMEDIQSASALDYDRARDLLSLLVRKGALLRVTRSEYAKNPEFITMLKRIRASGENTPNVEGDEF